MKNKKGKSPIATKEITEISALAEGTWTDKLI
jgi:hypothetical protein